MSEINSKNNQNTNKSFYIELPADISAKPNTLCNLITNDNPNITLVFCEYSELQFVENVISKRGIIAKRLNGYLDPEQIPALQDYIKRNKIQAIVLTQNSCRNLEELKVDLIINYSLADLTTETYQQRLNLLSEKEASRCVTLVGLRDLTSFLPLSKSLAENTENPLRMEKISAPDESTAGVPGKIPTLLKSINIESLQLSPSDLNTAEELLKHYQDNVAERETITKLIAHFVIKQLPNNNVIVSNNNRSINDELSYDKKETYNNEEENREQNKIPAKEVQIKSVTFKVSQGLDNEMNFQTFCSLAEEFAGADAQAISELSVSSDSMSLETTIDNFRIISDNLNGIEHNGTELAIEALSELPRNFKRNNLRPNTEGGNSHVYLTGKDRGNGAQRHSRGGGGHRNNQDRGSRGGYGRNNGGGGYRGRSDDRRGGGDDRSNGGGYDRRGGSERDGGGGGYRGRNEDRRGADGRSSGGYGQRRSGGYGGGGRSSRSRFDNR